MKKSLFHIAFLTAILLLAGSAQAWAVAVMPGTFTAQWTDANGVARSSPANSNSEVYVGNTGRYVMHNVTTIADSVAARNGTGNFFACYSALETCLGFTVRPDANAQIQVIPSAAAWIPPSSGALDFNLTIPTTQSAATLNLCYCNQATFAGPLIGAKTALTVYAYPTDADLGHIFAYAKSLPQFAGAGSVQSIAIPQGHPGVGTYKYILSADKQWAVGINADDGKLWLYNGSGFQAYGNWWTYLKDAQSKGF